MKALCPNYDVKFSDKKLDHKHLNILYNIVDVGVNISSAEGFGLSCAEAIMAGNPVIVKLHWWIAGSNRLKKRKWRIFDQG